MQIQLQDGEKIIKKGKANCQQGIQAVGGHLYLTSSRLIFEPHGANFRAGNIQVNLSNLQSAEPSWALILGFLPFLPMGLRITTRSGNQYRFVVFAREQWAYEIQKESQRARATAPS